jgi:hypothetical protein
MHYKTIVLELLKQRPPFHEQLRRERMLLTMTEALALDLKTRHEDWKEQLATARPGSDPSQIASVALEIALKELEDYLLPALPPEEDETLSLDAAMAFLRRPSPPA